MRRLDASGKPVVALAYAPDDPETLATLDAAGFVRLWNLVRGLAWASLYTGGRGEGHLAFTADGDALYVSNREGGVRRLDVALERWDEDFYQDPDVPRALCRVAVSAAGFLAKASCDSDRASVYRLPDSWWRDQAFSCAGGVRGLAFSPDGSALAAADGERRVQVWEINPSEEGMRTVAEYVWGETGPRRLVQRQEGVPLLLERAARRFRAAAAAVAFGHGDGSLAVAVGRGVELWDAALKKRRQSLKGHTRPVRSLAFSPGGGELLTGGEDGTVRLWEVATGRQRAALNWGLGPVHAVAFALDGMTAAACGAGGPGAVLFDVDA